MQSPPTCTNSIYGQNRKTCLYVWARCCLLSCLWHSVLQTLSDVWKCITWMFPSYHVATYQLLLTIHPRLCLYTTYLLDRNTACQKKRSKLDTVCDMMVFTRVRCALEHHRGLLGESSTHLVISGARKEKVKSPLLLRLTDMFETHSVLLNRVQPPTAGADTIKSIIWQRNSQIFFLNFKKSNNNQI